MTVRGYPFDTTDPEGSVTELEWRRMMRWIMQTGVVLAQLNEFLVAERAAGANMSVEAATGEAFVVGHYVRSDAVVSLAIGDNATGDDRIDLVVVGFDFVANTADVYVKQGAAGGPVAPVPTEDITTEWEIPLAEVLVAAGENVSIVDGDITDVRTIVVAPTIDATAGLSAGDLFYLNAAGLLVPIPLGALGQSLVVGASAPEWGDSGASLARAKRVAGNITLNSTSWAAVGVPNLTLPAVVGDRIAMSASGLIASEAVELYFDAASIVAAAPVNYVSSEAAAPAALGIQGFFCPSGVNTTIGNVTTFVVQAGDLSGGNVTMELRYKSASAANRTFNASASQPFVWQIMNFGQ